MTNPNPNQPQPAPEDPNGDAAGGDASGGDAAAFLGQYDAEWAGVQPPERKAAAELHDGNYRAFVENAEVKRSTEGRWMLSWMLRVIGGAHADAVVFRQNMLDAPDRLPYLMADLATCGMELARVSDLPGRVAELNGLVVDVRLKTTTKGDRSFQNVYLNKCHGPQAATPPAGTAPAVAQHAPAAPVAAGARPAPANPATRQPAPPVQRGKPTF